MISTTFQLGTNGTYVEKFLIGSGNLTDEEDFMKSVVLAIETLGEMYIDYDYEMENDTISVVPVPESNLNPNPSVKSPEPDNVIVPAPVQPEVQNQPEMNQAPEPEMNQEPGPVMNQEPGPVMNQAPEPVMNQEPGPVMNQEPESVIVPVPGFAQPTNEEPAPSSQNPEGGSVPGPMKKRVVGLPTNNDTLIPVDNTNSTEQVPSPSINNSTLNATTTTNFTSNANITTNFTSQWVHVYFTPKTFNVTILSNETDIYYIKNGPCMPLINYWNHVTLGCPCNSTWNNTGYYNSTSKCFEGGRQITPSLCPNNTCHEAFFLNDTTIYANLRLNTTTWSNGTIANKTAEITKLSPYKDIGYAYDEKDIIAVFLLSNGTEVSLPSVEEVTGPMNDTANDSGSVSLPITSLVTMMFAFLLIMYENTQ
jgi:hypothetical protein